MGLTKEQIQCAWESWLVQETERLETSIAKGKYRDDSTPDAVLDIAMRGLMAFMDRRVPLEHAVMSATRLAYDFGRYVANLECEESSLTVDEHDGTVLNIIPYAGEGRD